jgi:hypothetical protein
MKDFIKSVYGTIPNRDEFIDKLISYEAKMMKLFKELELKANQQQLLRAFVIACNGDTEFEASFTELDSLMHKKGKGSRIAANALKTLGKWQEEHKIELVRVIQPGQRKRMDDGTFEYLKTKFKFVFLEEIINVFYNDGADFEDALDELTKSVKAQFKGAVPKRKYHPRENLKRAKKTIETKFVRVYEFAMASGLNPVKQCQLVLENMHNILGELNAESTGKDNRAKFIMNFESKLVDVETQKEVAIKE